MGDLPLRHHPPLGEQEMPACENNKTEDTPGKIVMPDIDNMHDRPTDGGQGRRIGWNPATDNDFNKTAD